jgi:uncharacterized Fe-S cluster protein YjdI
MDDPRNRQYTNGEITVFWKPAKCIHATTCFRELIEVFNPGRRPWVNMDGAPTRRIIEVVKKCPTQALEWKYNREMDEAALAANVTFKDEVTPETLTRQNESIEQDHNQAARVKIMKNGPIVVDGHFEVTGADGNKLRSVVMTSFCRCGGSKSMPFCDGTHRKIGFIDTNE